jgi:predicted HAD superfamily Cof-like phosphohydrolase
MTFEGQYLTYAEYTELGGSAMAEMPFNILEFEARRQIDIRTFNRLKDVKTEDIPQEVKLCEYALINSIKSYEETTNNVASNGNVASENTDGYSISYITADKVSDIVKSKQNEIDNIIRTYLLGVIYNEEHLMYCGV